MDWTSNHLDYALSEQDLATQYANKQRETGLGFESKGLYGGGQYGRSMRELGEAKGVAEAVSELKEIFKK